MNIGIAQVDITPAGPVEMCGFAAREHPSIGVLDPIFAKALYLEHESSKLLCLAADVIAFDREFVQSFRDWSGEKFNLNPSQILLAATHTHSAPATAKLTGCGRVSESYLGTLRSRLEQTTTLAVSHCSPCTLHIAEAEVNLSIDRRNKPSAHTDPRALAIGFRGANGSFLAAAVNYAMHPVALGAINRHISADWPGGTTSKLSQSLPGRPIVLFANGAAGNLNPPVHDAPYAQVREVGEKLADALVPTLLAAPPQTTELRTRAITVKLPLETLSPDEIDRIAQRELAKVDHSVRWGKSLEEALLAWQRSSKNSPDHVDIELQAIRLGPIDLLAVNGEMFSRFTALLREQTRRRVYVIAYANAAFGYVPTRQAYPEGGYEVDTAHFFYNSLRPRAGGLELLADRATELLASL